MENGRTKSMRNKLTGPFRMQNLTGTKVNTSISILRSGKIKILGGALLL